MGCELAFYIATFLFSVAIGRFLPDLPLDTIPRDEPIPQSNGTESDREEVGEPIRSVNESEIERLKTRFAERVRSRRQHQASDSIPHECTASQFVSGAFVSSQKCNEFRQKMQVRRDPAATLQFSESTVNAELLLWDGDVLLSNDQAAYMESELFGNEDSNLGPRRKRKVSRLPYFLWPTLPIPYAFADSFPDESRRVVRETLALYENNTCVRFQEDGEARHRLDFRSGLGCSSFIGQMGGVQEISIQSPACALHGIVAHEIGHALGLFHEQGRPDQGSYVGVDFGNIHALHWANFLPQSPASIDYGTQPYDMGSVMHYGPYGFALNDERPALFSKDPRYQSTIGQRRKPTFVDFAQINRSL